MRQAAHPLSAPIAFDVAFSRGAREFLRVASAFALFLVLLAPARAVGLDRLYAKAILAVAQGIVVSTQHFPILARLDNPTVHNLGFGVILTFALFLVSTNLDLVSRIKRFGLAFIALFSFHVIASVLTIKVWVAEDLLTSMDILVLSPAEFRVVDWLKYFFYDLGLEIASFVIMLLTIAWNLNASRNRGRATKRRRPEESNRGDRRRLAAAAIVLGFAGILSVAAILYGRFRETRAGHVEAHAKIGHAFWNGHRNTQAAEQYRMALSGGTKDPQVFYNLSRTEARVGNRGAARRLLDQGIATTHDPVWRSRFQEAIDVMQSKAASGS